MIGTTKKSDNEKQIKQLAEEYHVGMSTIHGAESFYEFLRPEHKEKKAWICNGSACMCAGTQGKVRKKLSEKFVIISGGALGIDKVAHENALTNTIMVSPSSLDIIYPKANEHLIKEIEKK